MEITRLVNMPIKRLRFTLFIERIGRYGFLLVSMCLMISLKPFLNNLIEATLLTDIFFTIMLMSSIYAVSKTPAVFRFSCLLVSAVICLKIVHHALGGIHYLHILELVLTLLFLMQMLLMIVEHLIIEQKVTADIIMGSACAFVLLGFFWAYGYYLLEALQPNSFKGIEQPTDDLGEFMYFSFITLTSLGYGDIIAVSQQARGLTVLEAIIGQLYLAIMVSRLVGMYTSELQRKQGSS